MCEEDLFENLLQEIIYTHSSGHTDKWGEDEFREWLRPIVEETYQKATMYDDLKKEEYPIKKWLQCRKKPVVVEYAELTKPLVIETKEGRCFASPRSEFLIRGVEGEYYPINKRIFYKTYDVIESINNGGERK